MTKAPTGSRASSRDQRAPIQSGTSTHPVRRIDPSSPLDPPMQSGGATHRVPPVDPFGPPVLPIQSVASTHSVRYIHPFGPPHSPIESARCTHSVRCFHPSPIGDPPIQSPASTHRVRCFHPSLIEDSRRLTVHLVDLIGIALCKSRPITFASKRNLAAVSGGQASCTVRQARADVRQVRPHSRIRCGCQPDS